MKRLVHFLIVCGMAQAAVPLSFEPQDGNRFTARAAQYSAVVQANGYQVRGASGKYELRFEGIAAQGCEGTGRRNSRSNYMMGRDASKWRVRVPQFEKVRCASIYQGVDVVYYFTRDGLLEFDLELRPGASLDSVRIAIDSSDRGFRLLPPVAYQISAGRRREIPSNLVAEGTHRYRFQVPNYDKALPLIVDPVLAYSTYLGGTGGSSGEAVATDKDGNVYVTGTVTSNYFPVTESYQPLFGGSNDIFLSKFDKTGQNLIFSTYIGSYGDDRALDLKVDAGGNVYIVGYSSSPEFPMVAAAQEKFGGGSIAAGGDIVVLAVDASGSNLLFSTYIGGTLDDFGRSIALDKDGSIWIAGSTQSQDFPLVNPLQDQYSGGTRDCVLIKLAPMGERILFSTYLGGGGVDEFTSVAVAADGGVFVGGVTTSTNINVVNAFQPRYGGGARDILAARLTPDFSSWVFVTYLGGAAEDYCRMIAVDASDNLYITGFSLSGAYPRRLPYKNTYGGGRDAILTKMAPDGKSLVYSTFLGSTSLEDAFAIAVTPQGEAIVAGMVQSLAFPVVEGIQEKVGGTCAREACTADGFITRFAADGSKLTFSTYFGGSAAEQIHGATLSPDGTLWVTGFTASTNLPVAGALFPRNPGGGANVAFVSGITF
ncbi:MAG: SBBP repeat-containing protein [Candidatus Solibacter usitatus]|nr:SBBP repeat-containing protein [Candidatus Solibacter usitatus]